MPIPRLVGRLQPQDIGLVVNTADPLSVAVGAYYAAARGLAPGQVLRIELPVRARLERHEFERLQGLIAASFGASVQALVLAWAAPYAVECNSLVGALALGFDQALCRNSCSPPTIRSRYFNTATARPYADLGFRPAMHLAARTLEEARALVDRGVAADGSLATARRPPVLALQIRTDDTARNVRASLFLPDADIGSAGVRLRSGSPAELPGASRLLLALTGSAQVPLAPPPRWVPGGLGDHLTSFGGDLLGTHDHSTALDWIASGATASHGTVSEPCNHIPKFPNPQVLLGHYLQGATALEAYWKSVAWPQQSLFIGEPLAAPFARPAALAGSAPQR